MNIGVNRILIALLLAALSGWGFSHLVAAYTALEIAKVLQGMALPFALVVAAAFQVVSKIDDLSKEKGFSITEMRRLHLQVTARKWRVITYMYASGALVVLLGFSPLLVGLGIPKLAEEVLLFAIAIGLVESIFFFALLVESYFEISEFTQVVRKREHEREVQRNLLSTLQKDSDNKDS